MIFTFLFFVVGVYSVWSQECAYTPPEQHTMCIFSETPACDLLDSGVKKEDIAGILDTHNKLRNQVATNTMDKYKQPPAANMKQLVWDDELATIAQRWANQCQGGHDVRRDTKKYGQCGQNVDMMGSTDPIVKPEYEHMINTWFNEVKDVPEEYITSHPANAPTMIYHYTQLAWANTEAVGCGLINYTNGTWYFVRFVCNYGPSGNVIGQPMYKIGEACSNCDDECSDEYMGLCL